MYDGARLPYPAYGTYKSTLELGRKPMELALEAGYRHFDTAKYYFNEEDLGQVLAESGIPREEIFITTKLWAGEQGYDNAWRGLEEALKKLRTDYVDLFLIHWPRKDAPYNDPADDSWKELNRETWRAFNHMYEQGLIKHLGVSNFLQHHIENIETVGRLPMVDQIEFHPGYAQVEIVEYCHRRGIVAEGWSPFGRARMFSHPLLVELAEKYGVTVAGICVKFALQMGVMPVMKASSIERIRENMTPPQVEISDEDMKRILAMPVAGWSGEHPDRKKQAPVVWEE